MKNLKYIFAILVISTLCEADDSISIIEKNGKFKFTYPTAEQIRKDSDLGIPCAYQILIDLYDAENIWTDFEVKVIDKFGEEVFFFSTHIGGTSGFANSHPDITDCNAKVLFTTPYGDSDGRKFIEYPHKTLNVGMCLGVYVERYNSQLSPIIIFRPDWSKEWVRAAFLNPENTIIYWRSNPITSECISPNQSYQNAWGKFWRAATLSPIFSK